MINNELDLGKKYKAVVSKSISISQANQNPYTQSYTPEKQTIVKQEALNPYNQQPVTVPQVNVAKKEVKPVVQPTEQVNPYTQPYIQTQQEPVKQVSLNPYNQQPSVEPAKVPVTVASQNKLPEPTSLESRQATITNANQNVYTQPTVQTKQGEYIPQGNPYLDIPKEIQNPDVLKGQQFVVDKLVTGAKNLKFWPSEMWNAFKNTINPTQLSEEQDALRVLDETYGGFENMPKDVQVAYRNLDMGYNRHVTEVESARESSQNKLADIANSKNEALRKVDLAYANTKISDDFKFVADLGSAVIDMAPMVTVGAFTGGAGALPFMSLKVYSDSLAQAYADGADREQAQTYAFINTAIEVGTEALVGGQYGMVGIFDKTVENAIAKASFSPVAHQMTTLLYDAFGEGAEEIASEYLGHWLSSYTYKGQDQRSMSTLNEDALYSGLVGAMSSLVTNLVGSGAHKAYVEVKSVAMQSILDADSLSKVSIDDAQKLFSKVFDKSFEIEDRPSDVHSDVKAYYNTKKDKVIVYSDTKNALGTALVHEYLHSLQLDTENYKKYEDYVATFYNKYLGGSINTEIARVKMTYAMHNQILTTQEAMDEIVAFFTQNYVFMLNKGEISRSMLEYSIGEKSNGYDHIKKAQDFLSKFGKLKTNKAMLKDSSVRVSPEMLNYAQSMQDLFSLMVSEKNLKAEELIQENALRATLGQEPLTLPFISNKQTEFNIQNVDDKGNELREEELRYFNETTATQYEQLKVVSVNINGETKQGYVLTINPFDASQNGFEPFLEYLKKVLGEMDFANLTKEQADRLLTVVSLYGYDSVPYNQGQSYAILNPDFRFRELGHDYSVKATPKDVKYSIELLSKQNINFEELSKLDINIINNFSINKLVAKIKTHQLFDYVDGLLSEYNQKERTPEQIKSLDGLKAYAEDFAINYRENAKKDAFGNRLYNGQLSFLEKVSESLKDEDGLVLPMFHGTNAIFDTMSYDSMIKNGNVYGAGFYGTTNMEYAMSFAGLGKSVVRELYFRLENPIVGYQNKISNEMMSDVVNEYKNIYSDIVREYNTKDSKEVLLLLDLFYEEKVPELLAKMGRLSGMVDFLRNKETLDLLNRDWNYFAKSNGISSDSVLLTQSVIIPSYYNAFKKITSYDGIVIKDKWDASKVTAVAFFSNQVKDVTNKKPDLYSSSFTKESEKKSMIEVARYSDELISTVKDYGSFKEFISFVTEDSKTNASKYSSISTTMNGKEWVDWGLARNLFEQYQLQNQSKEVKKYSPEKSVEILKKSNLYNKLIVDWGTNVDSDTKIDIFDSVINNVEARSAMLSIMYDNYKTLTGENVSFAEFLDSEITMYRGQPSSKKLVEQDRFVSYSLSMDVALDFASMDSGYNYAKNVDKITIKPSDTFGSFASVALKNGQYNEYEILVPRTVVKENSKMFNKYMIEVQPTGKDNLGLELSQGQKNFLSSVSRHMYDSNGDLIRLYHGTTDKTWATPNGNLFLTDDRTLAGSYVSSATNSNINANKERLRLSGELAYVDENNFSKSDLKKALDYLRQIPFLTVEQNSDNAIVLTNSNTNKSMEFTASQIIANTKRSSQELWEMNNGTVRHLYAKFERPFVLDFSDELETPNWDAMPITEEYLNGRLLKDNDENPENARLIYERLLEESYKDMMYTDGIKNIILDMISLGEINTDSIILKGISDYGRYVGRRMIELGMMEKDSEFDVITTNHLMESNPRTVMISLEESQIKDVRNVNPTDSNDIRLMLETIEDSEAYKAVVSKIKEYKNEFSDYERVKKLENDFKRNGKSSVIYQDREFFEFRRNALNKNSTLSDSKIVGMFLSSKKIPKLSQKEDYEDAIVLKKSFEGMFDFMSKNILAQLPPYDVVESKASKTSMSFYLHFDNTQENYDAIKQFVTSYNKDGYFFTGIDPRQKTLVLRISDHYQMSKMASNDDVDFSLNIVKDMNFLGIESPRIRKSLKRIATDYAQQNRNYQRYYVEAESSVVQMDSTGKRKLNPDQIAFFKNTKAKDSQGRLLRVYHGTFFQFDEFNTALGFSMGAMGRGIYTTDSKFDAKTNYTQASGDTQGKYMRYVANLIEKGMDEENAIKLAEKQFDEGRLISAYVNITNPAIVANPKSNENTILFDQSYGDDIYFDGMDMDAFDDAMDDKLIDLYAEVEADLKSRGIIMIGSQNGDTIVSAMANALIEGGMSIVDFGETLYNYDYRDSEGHDAVPEVLRTILEFMGYDGIIDKTYTGDGYESMTKFYFSPEHGDNMPLKANHYIVFKPNQIKYVENEHPTLNNDMRRMVYMSEQEIQESQKAVEDAFGYTEDFNQSGFLLLNGKLLNMPKKDGYSGDIGADRLRHDIVNPYIEQGQFQVNGNIRFRPEGNLIQIMAKPTEEQMKALPQLIMNFKRAKFSRLADADNIYVSLWDFNNPKWANSYKTVIDDSVKTFALGSVEGIVSFVDNYYNGKVKQYESPFASFRDKMMIEVDANELDEPEVQQNGSKIVPDTSWFDVAKIVGDRTYYKMSGANLERAYVIALANYKPATEAEVNQAIKVYDKHKDAPTAQEIADNKAKLKLTDEFVLNVANALKRDDGFTLTSSKKILRPKAFANQEKMQDFERMDDKTYVSVRHIFEGDNPFDVNRPDLIQLRSMLEEAYSNIRLSDENVGGWVSDGILYLDISIGINQTAGKHADRVGSLIGNKVVNKDGKTEQQLFNMRDGSFPHLKGSQAEDAIIHNILSQTYLNSPEEILALAKEKGQKISLRKHEITAIEAGLTKYINKRIDSMIDDGEFTYVVHTDKEALEYAHNQISINLSGTHDEQVKQALEAKKSFVDIVNSGVALNKNNIAVGEVLIKTLADLKQGKEASDLISIVAMIGTEMGQNVQALSLIKKLSAQGKLLALRRAIERMRSVQQYNKGKFSTPIPEIKWDTELEARILQETDAEKVDALMDEYKIKIAEQLPVKLMDKLNAWRYMSMLGNPRTHIRNILGNAMFVVPSVMKDYVGTALESIFVKEEQRTKAFLNRLGESDKVLIDFATRDFEKVQKDITGQGKYDVRTDLLSKRRIFKPEALEWSRNLVFDALEKEDVWFMRKAYVRSLAQVLKARNLDVKKMSIEDLAKARQYAIEEAQKITYRDASAFANWLTQIEKKGGYAGLLMQSIVPFKKTPINIMKRGYEYSPIGLVTTLLKGSLDVHKGKITSVQFIDNISAGLSGTGIALLGAFMFNMGLLNAGDDEDESYKVLAYERSLGMQKYSLNIFGGTYTIDWMVPAIMPLAVGAEIEKMISRYNDGESIFKYAPMTIERVFDPIFEMTMLQGVIGALHSYSSGVGSVGDILSNASANYVNQYIPTLLAQITRSIQESQGSTYAPTTSVNQFVEENLRKMANKIPVESVYGINAPSIDVHGNIIKQEGNFLSRLLTNMLSPAYFKENTANAQDKELLRLYELTKDASVIPDLPPKSFPFNGDEYVLDNEEYSRFSQELGKTSYKLIQNATTNRLYLRLSSDDKVDIINKLYDYAKDKAKASYLITKGKVYDDNTYVKQQEAINAGINLIDYLLVKQEFAKMSSDDNTSRKEKFIEYINKTGLSDQMDKYLELIGGYSTDDEGTKFSEKSSSTTKPSSTTTQGSTLKIVR